MNPYRKFVPKRVPFIPQMEAVECGAACLAMVLAYHGHNAPLAEVRQACSVGRDGTSANSLIKAAQSYQLKAEAYHAPLDALEEMELPAIIHWDFNHFLVLERLTRRGAVVVDPAMGRMHKTWQEIDKYYTGVALEFEPTDNFMLRPSQRPSLAKYYGMMLKSAPLLLQVLGHSILLQVLALVPAMSSQFLLDRVVIPKQEAWLVILAVALGATWLGRTLSSFCRSYVVQGLQVSLDMELVNKFMSHLLNLPMAFFLQRRTGDLMARMGSLSSLRSFFTSRSVSFILDGFQLIGYGALMIAWQPFLGISIVALATIRVSLSVGMRSWFRQIMDAELATGGRENAVLMESISALETVKSSQAESRMVERWTGRMVDTANLGLKRRKLELGSGVAFGLFQAGTVALITWLGGTAVIEERMTIGAYAAFMMLQGMVTGPLESLLSAYSQFQYLKNHFRRIDDVLETSVEPQGSIDPGKLSGMIEVEGLNFRYDPTAPWALEDIYVTIRPGEKIALVGPTGAGKSTLARILLGMHQPEKGSVRFDGRPIEALDLQKLRSQMGVVLQDTFLFNDTVRANMSLNNPDLGMDRLVDASRRACILDVIESLPQGFDTPLGENGSRLSGGQRQRLNLARALAHGPSILLLDEATSSLDLETEGQLHANLAAMRCTRIVIAHRLATVKDADRIFVLDKGRIVQRGNYQELQSSEGLFRNLVKAMEDAYAG
ncbi:MAG: peptidase domain-containing ABC transporter [Holophagaceae bacterium]|nr:peptidase domain-containing ABC transporter [Holophagaceae bacterium]